MREYHGILSRHPLQVQEDSGHLRPGGNTEGSNYHLQEAVRGENMYENPTFLFRV